jgi:pyruvate-ferredoxin/flavodoxin oxidoreductase
LSLDGNPAAADPWPEYELRYLDDGGVEQKLTLPVTTADWAATEARFKRHFTPLPADAPAEDLLPFHEYVAAAPADREGKRAYIHVLGPDRRLGRLAVADEIARLAEDRLAVWALLKEMAGLAAGVADGTADLAAELERVKAEYEQRIVELKARYPALVARRLAEGLIKAGNGGRTIADLLLQVERTSGLAPVRVTAPAAAAPPVAAAPTATATSTATDVADDAALALEPYIDSARCTACNECTNINKKLFAYNDQKQAHIKDPRAGTFKELVMAAERCPVRIIHPGTPLNPKEKDPAKWVERAAPFN